MRANLLLGRQVEDEHRTVNRYYWKVHSSYRSSQVRLEFTSVSTVLPLRRLVKHWCIFMYGTFLSSSLEWKSQPRWDVSKSSWWKSYSLTSSLLAPSKCLFTPAIAFNLLSSVCLYNCTFHSSVSRSLISLSSSPLSIVSIFVSSVYLSANFTTVGQIKQQGQTSHLYLCYCQWHVPICWITRFLSIGTSSP